VNDYVSILEEAAKYFDAPAPDVQNWLVDMKARQPGDIPSEWWTNELIRSMVKPGAAEAKQRILQKVAAMVGKPVVIERTVIEPQKHEPEPERKKPKGKAAPLPIHSRRSLTEAFDSYEWPE
jgi:hypothetical protein